MLDANTTIYWHGLTAYTAPFSNGALAASQWPIPLGYFFNYEVWPEPGTAGTYFYHSYVGFQAITAKGPLVVESCDPPLYDYNKERTILISDYFSKTDAEIGAGLTSLNFTWSGETDAVLVNGHSQPATNATGSCELAAINIEAGKTYRLRFIGGTALSFVSLTIDSHEVSVIEADGHDTKPLKTDFLQLASGQRYSMILKAKSEAELVETKTC
ncbi:multicopper oxidase-domain-containing protein [Aspergillus germanicus]